MQEARVNNDHKSGDGRWTTDDGKDKVSAAVLKEQGCVLVSLFPLLFFLCCFLSLATPALAVRPEIWRENSQQAFEKGKPDGISLTREGTVTLSPELTKVADTGEGFVWALASDGKGALYIATGTEGRIFVLKPGRKTPDLLFDSPEVAIYSLLVGPDGAVYAGSSPGGLIYRLAPGKEPLVFCSTGDEHVWALSPRPGGGLYAATGGKQGRVLKISPTGETTAIYTSKDPNVVSLTSAPDGVLYAGTDQNGLIYRIEKEAQTHVLYDAGEKEIRALVIGQNNVIYAAAMAGDVKQGDKAAAGGKGGSTLYAIRPSGSALRLWEVDDPLLVGLTLNADGSLTAVTGKTGRVYRVWPDGSATLLSQLENVRPWAVFPVANDLWIGASGAGLIYRQGQPFAQKGTLTSEPRDFALVSHWGRASWWSDQPSGTAISVQTRSGNSETPDDTWSDWSAPLTAPGAQITSRPARFLQYRITLTSSSGKTAPYVREMQLAGLQENLPPMVLEVKAEPVPLGERDGKKTDEVARGIWRLSWTAGDANNDTLIHAIYFRGLGDPHWKLLKNDVTAAQYIWNTESVPDGITQVRVVASDRLSNPAHLSLTGEAISAPFDIDNTPPVVQLNTVQNTGAGSVRISGALEDADSAIREAAYSLNADDWQMVFPADGIFDSPSEHLSFAIDHLKPGAYTLVVRTRDAAGNIGVGKTAFEVK